MSEPNLDDVIQPTESAPHDRTPHGKQPPRLNGDELEHRSEHERVQAGLEDHVPDEVPSAED